MIEKSSKSPIEVFLFKLSSEERSRLKILAWLDATSQSDYLRGLINEKWQQLDLSDPTVKTLLIRYGECNKQKLQKQEQQQEDD